MTKSTGTTIDKGVVTSREDVLRKVLELGLWPIAQTVEASESAGLPHWHTWDTHLWLLEGEIETIDPVDGSHSVLTAGDYQLVPARTLHAARARTQSTLIAAYEEPRNLSMKSDYTPDELE